MENSHEDHDGQGSIPCGSSMKVTLDEHGIELADVAMKPYVKHHLDGKLDMHFSNVLTLEILRAALHEMPIDERPPITWIVYGKEVFFDKDLKSHDAWKDPRTDLITEALMILL